MNPNPYARSLMFGAVICLIIGGFLLLPLTARWWGFYPMIIGEGGPPWPPSFFPFAQLYFGTAFSVLGFAQLTCWQVVGALRWRDPAEEGRPGVDSNS